MCNLHVPERSILGVFFQAHRFGRVFILMLRRMHCCTPSSHIHFVKSPLLKLTSSSQLTGSPPAHQTRTTHHRDHPPDPRLSPLSTIRLRAADRLLVHRPAAQLSLQARPSSLRLLQTTQAHFTWLSPCRLEERLVVLQVAPVDALFFGRWQDMAWW